MNIQNKEQSELEEKKRVLFLEVHNTVFKYVSSNGVLRGADKFSELQSDLMYLITAHTNKARRIAKEENARDFSAVVKAFNTALTAGFDAPSVITLRMVINGADARANYVDLPAQLAKETTS